MDLRYEREKKFLTQQQLADLIQVDRTLISKIESGSAMPSVVTAKKIAAALDFDWTRLFDDDHDAGKEAV